MDRCEGCGFVESGWWMVRVWLYGEWMVDIKGCGYVLGGQVCY